MILTISTILVISFIMALWSMRDFKMPDEIQKLLMRRKIKGTIVFLKDKVKHYSSDSASS